MLLALVGFGALLGCACGLLADGHWARFLAGYREARTVLDPDGDVFGLGRRPGDDPWPVLDAVARPCVVQTAAAGVRRAAERVASGAPAGLDEVGRRLLDACRRIAAGP